MPFVICPDIIGGWAGGNLQRRKRRSQRRREEVEEKRNAGKRESGNKIDGEFCP
jgi:hypothetical protein